MSGNTRPRRNSSQSRRISDLTGAPGRICCARAGNGGPKSGYVNICSIWHVAYGNRIPTPQETRAADEGGGRTGAEDFALHSDYAMTDCMKDRHGWAVMKEVEGVELDLRGME